MRNFCKSYLKVLVKKWLLTKGCRKNQRESAKTKEVLKLFDLQWNPLRILGKVGLIDAGLKSKSN